MGWLLDAVVDQARWVLVLSLLLTAGSVVVLVDFSSGSLRLRIDPSAEVLLPPGGDRRRLYDLARRMAGGEDPIVIALGFEDAFARESLERVVAATAALEGVDGVSRVLSLATALNVRSRAGDVDITPFLEELPASAADREALVKDVLANPLYRGLLASEDRRTSALFVFLEPMTDQELADRGIDRKIAEVAAREAGDAEVWISGFPHFKAVMNVTLQRHLARVLPLVMLLLAATLVFAFRSPRGVLVPLATIAVSLLWTLGAIVAAGAALNVITVIVPPLILTLGFAYTVHVLFDYYQVLRARPEGVDSTPREVVREVLREVGTPVLVTGVTTAAGFLALSISRIPGIREFGLFSLMGVALTVTAALTFAPALLAVLPLPARVRAESDTRLLDRLALRLGTLAVVRRPLVLGASLLLLGISVWGATHIVVANDFISAFDEDAPARVEFEAIAGRIGGANLIQVMVEADERQELLEPANLAALREFQEWLEAQPEVGRTTSIVDYLMLLNRVFHDDETHFVVPERKRLAVQLLFLGSSAESARMIDAAGRIANITAMTSVRDTSVMRDLVTRTEGRLGQLPERLRAGVTGNQVLVSDSLNEVARGQWNSLMLAFGIIYLVLALLFTSFRIGLFALFPNALPIATYFGALGYTGVTLNTSTALVGCLALGIAVDDTVHYFARFNQEARKLGDELRATRSSLRSLIRPVTFTTVGLCLGFLILATSEIRSQVQFGVLAAFTLAVAWVIDLTLSPALCSRLRIVTLWDLLTIDIGPEPHRAIQIFDGLSAAQARIVALMGRLIDAPAGQRIFHAGEPGSGLYVVISGELRTWVSRQEGEVTLGHYERGESVGEVGFFQGEHATHCAVEQDARIVRLSSECLEQLGRRYPRVAATLHGNLNKTLAARLALRTRESALDDAFFRVPAIFNPLAEGGPGADAERVLDPFLTETLAGLGIRTETLAALTLIPLVRVAWADEHLDEEERRAVLRGAERVGIVHDSPGHALLRAWLEERPDPRIFEVWRDFVAALCSRLSIEGQLELREDLMGRAREVAQAAGGFLGVRSISRREEAVLRELESVFPV